MSAPALANAQSAATCASHVNKNAQLIYQSTAPKVTPSSDLQDEVRSATGGLAMGGQIEREAAKPTPKAAG